jgi:SAM-dependent methyltransferase
VGDRIELLDESLVTRFPEIAMEVLAGSARLKIPLGWHYLLDLTWLLSEASAPEGSVVLDAGAGLGLMQFLLAERGYRVISADMEIRKPSADLTTLYQFKTIGSTGEIAHDYLDHRGAARTPTVSHAIQNKAKSLLDTPPREWIGRFFRRPSATSGAAHGPNPAAQPNLTKPHDLPPRPTIELLRCNLESMPEVADASVDAVVSVSALEHNRPEEVKRIVRELQRVLKPGGAMLHTISACREGISHHEPSHSWLLDEAGIIDAYDLRRPESNFDRFDEVFESLRQSRYLRRWLSAFYYRGGKNGMPWGVWDPQYQPVGVRREMPAAAPVASQNASAAPRGV